MFMSAIFFLPHTPTSRTNKLRACLKKKDAQVGRQKVLRQLDFEPHNEIKKSD